MRSLNQDKRFMSGIRIFRSAGAILPFVILLLFGSCASKKYMNKALEMEEAGLFTEAADFYLRSLQANDDNLDSKLGLKRTGQVVLDKKIEQFMNYYRSDQYKDAVYAFIDAEEYHSQIAAFGIDLNFQANARTYYQEVKDIYLNNQYGKAVTLLDAENFVNALPLLTEILEIEAGYRNASELWITARYEPVYREGLAFLDNGKYRSAYYAFDEILTGTGAYKDAASLKEQAREEALIRIGVLSFSSSNLAQQNVANELKTHIMAGINQQKSPFYEIVQISEPDRRENSLEVFKEIFLNRETSRPFIPSNVDAVLSGKITEYSRETSSLKKIRRKAWLRETTTRTNEDGSEEEITSYTKVYYYEYSQQSRFNMSLSYTLTDAQSNKMLVNDLLHKNLGDEVLYAVFDGDYRKLIPGTWHSVSSESERDKKYEDRASIEKLQALFAGRKEIISDYELKKQALDELSTEIAQKIVAYNPEI